MTARPASIEARKRADLYATRAIVVELMRYLSLSNPDISNEIRNAAKRRTLKPLVDDVFVSEEDVRESFEAILQAATT
jgi:hypothetical protein